VSGVLRRLWKPWFVYRPRQLVRRMTLGPEVPGWQALATSWGGLLLADPTKTIGRSIRTTGLYDLAVSEVLARLIDPGDTVVDAGANVGYMTVLAAAAAGPTGRVVAFEPHPDLFAVLRQNVEMTAGRLPSATVDLHNAALGEAAGTAQLVLPHYFSSNDGVGSLATVPTAGSNAIPVSVAILDEALGEARVGLMKLDVEGFELHVLHGGRQALDSGRIVHIVFEDHDVERSQVVRLLQSAGYQVFAVGWRMRGLVVAPVECGLLAKDYEAPSFIATLRPDVVHERCATAGWKVLAPRFDRAEAGSRRRGSVAPELLK